MNATARPENHAGGQGNITQKLMVSGFVSPQSSCALSIEVRRGMMIRSKEGVEVGKVAAVVLNSDHHNATHILLGRLPEMSGYWLVPVDLVVEVRDESVQLSIPFRAIETLPRWHSV